MTTNYSLHSVDEKAIQTKLLPWLCKTANVPEELVAFFGEAELQRIVDDFQESLISDSKTAAAMIAELAIAYSSCLHPFEKEVDFSFAIWPDAIEDEAEKRFKMLPEHTVSTLFKNITAKHPELEGKYPEYFDGETTTGTYIPSENVSQIYECIQQESTSFTENYRAALEPLLQVLEYAKTNELGYWEGVNLVLPSQKTIPKNDTQGLVITKYPDTIKRVSPVLYADRNVVVFGITSSQPRSTLLCDFNEAEVRFQHFEHTYLTKLFYDEFSKNWIAHGWDTIEGEKIHFIRKSLDMIGLTTATSLKIQSKNASANEVNLEVKDFEVFQARAIGAVNGKVFVFPTVYNIHPVDVPLLENETGHLVPQTNLGKASNARIRFIPLLDGSGIVSWNENIFRCDGKEFNLILEILDGKELNTNTININATSFYGIVDRCLFRIDWQSNEVTPLLPDLDNIMELYQGPDGALLLLEGDNKKNHLGKLFYPLENKIIPITYKHFGLTKGDSITCLQYQKASKRIYAFAPKEFRSIPITDVEK